MLASIGVRLSVLLLITHPGIHAALFDSVCSDIASGERKIDVFGIWQHLPGHRFLLISGEYMYNQELDQALLGSPFHERPTITLSNRSLVRHNWPLLPVNYTNYTKDGAIVADSSNDWLVFRTDKRNSQQKPRKAIYQNMQNFKIIYFPEFKQPSSTDDFQLVSSALADRKYGIGPSDMEGTTQMCLFKVKKVDAANEASDYEKVDFKGRPDMCTHYDSIERAFIEKEGNFMYAIMRDFPNVTIYQIVPGSLKEVFTIQFNEFFLCSTYIDIYLLILVLVLVLVIVGVVAYLYLMQNRRPANGSLEAAMKMIHKRQTKGRARSPKGKRVTIGTTTGTSSSVATV